MKDNFEVYETPHKVFPVEGEKIDEYRILGKLGEGTFGVVFKVENSKGSVLALKLIKLWEIAFVEERKALLTRFLREYKISSTIKSQYLVNSCDYGKILGNPYIVMEYCAFGSLEDQCGQFSSNKHHDTIACHILKGLHELHREGFVHRDIKPANIVLTSDNRAKLTDFGIAGQKASRLTVVNIFGKPNQLFGTWAYMAPEQSRNKGGDAFKAMDAVTDIFSFGVTMFELFTGELPFPPYKIDSIEDLSIYRVNVEKGNYDNLSRKKQHIPQKWVPILENCLHADYQKKRTKKVSEIIEQLGFDLDQSRPVNSGSTNLGLQITYGEQLQKIYDLSRLSEVNSENVLTLGREDIGTRNHIEVSEISTTYISRKHATIEKWENPICWRIRDGQWTSEGWKLSLNGLFVNSTKVGPSGVKIQEGDIISIGDTTLKVIAI